MITLQIQVKSDTVTRRVKLSKEVSDEFDLYVTAAQELAVGVDESLVLEAILKNHLRKDNGFRAWMQQREHQSQGRP
jgi:hypothetical protein